MVWVGSVLKDPSCSQILMNKYVQVSDTLVLKQMCYCVDPYYKYGHVWLCVHIKWINVISALSQHNQHFKGNIFPYKQQMPETAQRRPQLLEAPSWSGLLLAAWQGCPARLAAHCSRSPSCAQGACLSSEPEGRGICSLSVRRGRPAGTWVLPNFHDAFLFFFFFFSWQPSGLAQWS